MNDKKTYTIGQFSKIVGIPVTALRYYDEQSILVPSARNHSSNYRYYSEDQIMEALTILQLKVLGISLPDIKLILDCRESNQMQFSLEEQLKHSQGEIQRLEEKYERTLQVYQQLGQGLAELEEQLQLLYRNVNLEQTAPTDFHCEINYYPNTDIVALPVETSSLPDENTLQLIKHDLPQICRQASLQVTGPVTMAFQEHDPGRFEGREFQSLLFYPIQATASKHAAIQKFGGFWTICGIHQGPYDRLLATYDKIIQQADTLGLQLIGGPFEEYLLNASQVSDENSFITKVSFPIHNPEQGQMPPGR